MYFFPNFEPVHYSMFGCNCCFLNLIQMSQETGKMIWYSHLFKNFLQFFVIHIVKGFGIVNEAEIDVFLDLSSFLYDPANVDNLTSGSSAFSKSSLYIWKFSFHVLLKSTLKDFEHNSTSMWNECNCIVTWTFLGIALLKLTFSSPVATADFSNLLTYPVQHFNSTIF